MPRLYSVITLLYVVAAFLNPVSGFHHVYDTMYRSLSGEDQLHLFNREQINVNGYIIYAEVLAFDINVRSVLCGNLLL